LQQTNNAGTTANRPVRPTGTGFEVLDRQGEKEREWSTLCAPVCVYRRVYVCIPAYVCVCERGERIVSTQRYRRAVLETLAEDTAGKHR